jgi:NADPH:quinone reductase-like Zn-dependent oxidoreductase
MYDVIFDAVGRHFLRALIESGSYRAVVDRRYPLDDVIEASRYVETEHKIGNVILTVGDGLAT